MLLANLKNSLKSIKNNPFSFLFNFLGLPIILALVLFNTQKPMMSSKINIKPISIKFIDLDNTEASALVKISFLTDEAKKYFIIDNDNDYSINIPQGFERNFLENNKVDLTVETRTNDPSIYDTELIKGYLDSISKELIKEKNKSQLVNSLENTEDQQNLIDQLNYIDSPIEIKSENILKEDKIPFNEYNGIVMMQYIFISYLLSSIVGGKKLSDTTSLNLRFQSLPVSKFRFSLTNIIVNSLILFSLSSIYILVSRAINMGFSKELYKNLLVALSISLTTASFLEFLGHIKESLALILSYIILYGQLIFGGMLGPVNKIFKNTIIERFMKINFNTILTNPFMDVGNGLFSYRSLIPGLMVTLFSITAIGIIIRFVKRERSV